MWWRLKWLILWSLWAGRVVRQPTSPVRVSSGWLRGSVAHSGTHAQYLGIPYATIRERFQAPGPEPTFDKLFEAINENKRCEQALIPHGPITMTIGQEDCLTLNVYTPLNTSPLKLLPVMIFIHGGGFLEGSSSNILYGPDYLTSKGVVLVTINYRLNVSGFLCLGIKEAPGNAGLKDQVEALRWVQRNIRAFGGDPDNVTVFGESAGAASISLHILSPMSKGLFHKAIQQSGSSLGSWAIQYDPTEAAIFKAKAVGYTETSKDPRDLYSFFKSKTDAEIITKWTKRPEGLVTVLSRIIFTPCIEKKLEGVEPFLTQLPHTILSEGKYNKVPMIIGSNAEEGILFMNMEPNEYIPKLDFGISLPKDLSFPSNDSRKHFGEEAKKLYMGDDEVSVKTRTRLSKFYGEPFFHYPALEETDLIVRSSDKPIFSYLFKYNGWRNIPLQVLLVWSPDLKVGATHADDLFYMFSQDLIPSIFERRMIDVVTTLWTNFAKYSDPTPSVTELLPLRWPAVKVGDQRALIIDHELTTGPMWYNNNTLPFWKNAYKSFRRKS